MLRLICIVQNDTTSKLSNTNQIQALMSLRIKTEHTLKDDVKFTVLYMFGQSQINERLQDVTPYGMSSDISASPRK